MAKKSEQATKLVLKVVTGQKADGTLSTAQRAFAGMNPALADEVFASGEIRQIASVEKRQFGSAEIRQFKSIEKSQS